MIHVVVSPAVFLLQKPTLTWLNFKNQNPKPLNRSCSWVVGTRGGICLGVFAERMFPFWCIFLGQPHGKIHTSQSLVKSANVASNYSPRSLPTKDPSQLGKALGSRNWDEQWDEDME